MPKPQAEFQIELQSNGKTRRKTSEIQLASHAQYLKITILVRIFSLPIEA